MAMPSSLLLLWCLVCSGQAGGGALETDELLARTLPVDYQAYMAEHGVFLDVEGILTTADSESHCFKLDIQLDSFFHSVIPDCSAESDSDSDYCHLSPFEKEQIQRAAEKVRSSFRRSLKKEEPLVNIVTSVLEAMKDPTAVISISDGQVELS